MQDFNPSGNGWIITAKTGDQTLQVFSSTSRISFATASDLKWRSYASYQYDRQVTTEWWVAAQINTDSPEPQSKMSISKEKEFDFLLVSETAGWCWMVSFELNSRVLTPLRMQSSYAMMVDQRGTSRTWLSLYALWMSGREEVAQAKEGV